MKVREKPVKKGATCIGCDGNPCTCKTPPRIRCDKDDICASLLRHLNLEANRGKGLSSFVLHNLDGKSPFFGKHRFAGIVYRESASDNGTMINYCPWCGASLRHFLKAKNWRPR